MEFSIGMAYLHRICYVCTYLHNSLARVGIHKPCRAVSERGWIFQKVHIIIE